MDTWVWIVIVAAVVLVDARDRVMATTSRRRRGLQDRFGPEYDRTVETADTAGRPRRTARSGSSGTKSSTSASCRRLPATRYFEQWRGVQTRFVDDPGEAVREGDTLVQQVMRERGYPIGRFRATRRRRLGRPSARRRHYRSAHGGVGGKRARRGDDGGSPPVARPLPLLVRRVPRTGGGADDALARDTASEDSGAEVRR